jgi:hypothetical protein
LHWHFSQRSLWPGSLASLGAIMAVSGAGALRRLGLDGAALPVGCGLFGRIRQSLRYISFRKVGRHCADLCAKVCAPWIHTGNPNKVPDAFER